MKTATREAPVKSGEAAISYWCKFLSDALKKHGEAYVREKWSSVCARLSRSVQDAIVDELSAPVWIAIEGGAIGQPTAEAKTETTAPKFVSSWEPPFIDPVLEGQIVEDGGIRYRIEKRPCELSLGGYRLMYCPLFDEEGGAV